ncbi:hypothetical protein KR009_000248, partial [Drosophila setifemur]
METNSTTNSGMDQIEFLKRKSKALFEHTQVTGLALDKEELRSATEEELTWRLELLDKTEASFIEIHDSLEELDFNEIGSPLLNEFEELIFSLKSAIQYEIRKRRVVEVRCSTMRPDLSMDGSGVPVQRRKYVPELKLSEFSGGYVEYGDFFSMFSTIIDKEPDLSPLVKLQHLRSCLKGLA